MRKHNVVIAVLALLTPAISQAASLEEVLAQRGVIANHHQSGSAAMGGGASKLYWNDGTRADFPDAQGFTVKVNTQIQSRYTFTDNDEDAATRDSSSFDTQRARLTVSGTALHEEFSYVLETEFSGPQRVGDAAADAKSPQLLDANISWHACDWVTLKMGQMKTALSRQFNTGSRGLQFADRSIASETVPLSQSFTRQNGLQAKGAWMDGDVEWGAGIYNGESTNLSSNDNKHTFVVNARWNALGKMNSFEEGDIGWTEDPALSFGAAYANIKQDGGDIDAVSVDANFKMAGWSVNGEYYWVGTNPDGGSTSNDNAFYVQTGYFLTPKKLEIAGRFARTDIDGTRNEWTAGLNYFFWNHNLKAQLNYVNVDDKDADIQTNKYIFQVGGYF